MIRLAVALVAMCSSGCAVDDASVMPDTSRLESSTNDETDAPSTVEQFEACTVPPGPGLYCDAHGLCSSDGGLCCVMPLPCIGPDPHCFAWHDAAAGGQS